MTNEDKQLIRITREKLYALSGIPEIKNSELASLTLWTLVRELEMHLQFTIPTNQSIN